MKHYSLTTSLGRPLLGVALVIGSAVLTGSTSTQSFTIHEKAYYADPNLVSFVRPGLVVKILSASIAADGTIRTQFSITDLKGLPLDRDGIVTPGTVTIRLMAAYIPKGQRQYTNYVTSASTGRPATDSGGVFDKVADGVYQYTFSKRVPSGDDPSVTHTIGIQANRNLTEFDLGTQYDNDVYSFVPNGGSVTVKRDVVRTATCNKCHDPLAQHGGNRRKVELCVLCHQPQNVDSKTGFSYDFPVLIHKIHQGSGLPSVVAGGKLVIGNTDYSDVVFPADVRNCEVCHDPNSGAEQSDAWLKQPNRAACGACHDDVNFATGANHSGNNIPQVSDNQCSTCHIPQGEIEFVDASIRNAHLDPRFSTGLPGVVFAIQSIANGVAGKAPTVTFSLKDKSGHPILPSGMTRLSLVLAGPTTDYASFVSEDVRKATGGTDGVYFWTFQNPIAANATGTYSVSIEGYRNITLLPGTLRTFTQRDAGTNQTSYFSVDGSKLLPRRTVVDTAKCNVCHLLLEMHGRNRNQVEHCVQCHNVNQTDAAGRPASAGAAQSISFRLMIHSIHTGADSNRPFVIYGGSGSANDFSDVRFPGDRRNCQKCHVNGSEQLPLPATVSPVNNPRAPFNPLGAVTAACTGCHTEDATYSHALANTTILGESCSVCHGSSALFSVDRVHAR